jgi:hypothetical protein
MILLEKKNFVTNGRISQTDMQFLSFLNFSNLFSINFTSLAVFKLFINTEGLIFGRVAAKKTQMFWKNPGISMYFGIKLPKNPKNLKNLGISYTQSVISTLSVISKSTNEIPTRTSVISTRRVWFYMSVVSTHTRVVLTRMLVNLTLTSVITTRTSVIYTRRV